MFCGWLDDFLHRDLSSSKVVFEVVREHMPEFALHTHHSILRYQQLQTRMPSLQLAHRHTLLSFSLWPPKGQCHPPRLPSPPRAPHPTHPTRIQRYPRHTGRDVDKGSGRSAWPFPWVCCGYGLKISGTICTTQGGLDSGKLSALGHNAMQWDGPPFLCHCGAGLAFQDDATVPSSGILR